MKLQLVVMCYNSADLIKRVLESWSSVIDTYRVFIDSKTTDGTYMQVKNFKNENKKKVIIDNFHFSGFANSRNECLDIAYDLTHEFTIFIDDSFELKGAEFLRKSFIDVLYNERVNGIAFKINRNGTVYESTRAIRTYRKIRYTGAIHETLQVETDHVINLSYINDLVCDNHLARTSERVKYDIKCLNGLEDARSLYYLSNCTIKLYMNQEVGHREVIKSINRRLKLNDSNHEERFLCYLNMGNIYLNEDMLDMCIECYKKASREYKPRSGEAYFCLYLLTEKIESREKESLAYLEKAYEHRQLGHSILPVDITVYQSIPEEYNRVFNSAFNK